MNHKELVQCCPDEVAEYIDQDLLPEKADGHHSATQIYHEWRDEALDRLLAALKDPTHYQKKHVGLDLIDSWIVWNGNKVIAIAYIQESFDGWLREEKANEE